MVEQWEGVWQNCMGGMQQACLKEELAYEVIRRSWQEQITEGNGEEIDERSWGSHLED